jgi:hypothetical protein
MELPLTWEAIRHTTDSLQVQRLFEMRAAIQADLEDPKVILQEFERDLRDSINKNEKKTHFTYVLASYPYIYTRFGKDDANKALLEMANNYIRNYFPIATATVDEIDGHSCSVIIHFSLPWLSGQTSSH